VWSGASLDTVRLLLAFGRVHPHRHQEPVRLHARWHRRGKGSPRSRRRSSVRTQDRISSVAPSAPLTCRRWTAVPAQFNSDRIPRSPRSRWC
jgi:hypothetical protein